MNEIIIRNINGELTCSSLDIARDFGKRLSDVHETIENLTAENSAVKNFFIKSDYINQRGREYMSYEITRDGFSLLVMGFTGRKALEWKLKYIEAFNHMEHQLRSGYTNIEEIIAKAVTAAVSETVKVLIPMMRQPTPEMIYESYEPGTYERRSHSIISQLSPELRTEVDDMLLSRKYTYADVRAFLMEQGVSITIASIARYKGRLYRK